MFNHCPLIANTELMATNKSQMLTDSLFSEAGNTHRGHHERTTNTQSPSQSTDADSKRAESYQNSSNSSQMRQYAKNVMSTSIAPLVNTVKCDEFFALDKVKCVAYGNVIETSSQVSGQPSITRNPVMYRIQRRDTNNKEALLRNHGNDLMAQKFKYNTAISDELQGLNRKYSNFSGAFKYGDMSAIIHRLAQALACYRAEGDLSWSDCMAGKPIKIRALGTFDDPVSASNAHVFIPRMAAMIDYPATFSALVMAANSTGSFVVTDVVNVTANNAPTVTTYEGNALAQGCFNALRIVLAMMQSCDAGCLASFALTKGMHDICTVVGHTDEGAYTRDILRKQGFVRSYGGIYTAMMEDYMGLPAPTTGDLASYSALVDSILLKTAAAVAIADPCELIGEEYFPSVFCSDGRELGDGSNNEGTAEDALNLSRKIGAGAGNFCKNYIKTLGEIFMVYGNEETAANFLLSAFQQPHNTANRHLRYNTVAPFYWIEPTGLFSIKHSTVANDHGFGVLVGTEEDDANFGIFERYKTIKTSTNESYLVCQFRSARTSGFILHHALNSLDGLGSMSIHQASFDHFALRGGINESIGTSVENRRNIGQYLWRRGDGGIPAPAELVYTGKKMMVRLTHLVMDTDLMITTDGMKSQSEIDIGYKMRVCKPWIMGQVEIGERTREVRRSRTQAAKALSRVHGWVKHCWQIGGDEVQIGNLVPVCDFGDGDRGNQGSFGSDTMKKEEQIQTERKGPNTAIVMQEQPLKVRLGNSNANISQVGVINTNITTQDALPTTGISEDGNAPSVET